MAMVLPPSRAEEDIMVGVTCAPPLPSMVATTSEEETTSITRSNTAQNGIKTDPLPVSRGAN